MKNHKNPLVLGVGEVLWDVLEEGKHLGGAPANFAYYAHAHGACSRAVSAVGNDALGREAMAQLSELGICAEAIATTALYPTSTVTVQLKGGQPAYEIHQPVAWDALSLTPQWVQLAQSADAICFGSLAQRSLASRSAIHGLLTAAPRSTLKVFDMNLRGCFYDQAILEESLALANVLKLNDQELITIAPMFALEGDEQAQLTQLQERYALQAVVLTKGEHGSVILAGSQVSLHPGTPTTVSDTIGAGDAFTATVTMGLLYGYELDDLHERASRVAAFVCSRPGATTPLAEALRMSATIDGGN